MDSSVVYEPSAIAADTPQAGRVIFSANAHYKGRVRTGCLVCRSRKVKCDEQRPSCQKCTKLKKTCVYGSRRGSKESRSGPQGPRPGKACLEERQSSADTSTAPDNVETLATEQIPPSEIQADPSASETPHVSPEEHHVPLEQNLLASLNTNPSPHGQHRVGDFYEDNDQNATQSPSRFELTSQHILLTLAMDLGLSDVSTQSSYIYFIDKVDCPIVSAFDSLNWRRMKVRFGQLAFQETSVGTAILAVQALYRAQAERLPMTHAMSLYQAALNEFETISVNNMVDFNIVLVVFFLLSLAVMTLPNEDKSSFDELDGRFVSRMETWILTNDRSPISLRIGAYLLFLDAATKRTGSPGLLPEPVSSLIRRHIMHPPSLASLEDSLNSANVLYDTVSTPLFEFYLELQKISHRVADLSHYRRSRITPTDQAEVTEIANCLKTQMSSLWEARPGPLRLLPRELRDNMSHTIVDPLIALTGVCIAAYLAEVVVLGRTLGDPPFASPEAIQAMEKIRDLIEGDWNASSGGALNPGYLRPLFVYAIESLSKAETQWAVDQLRQIRSPLSRCDFVASLAESLGEAQRDKGRRVTTKYFCYQMFGVPPPYM